jgi:hypothetical protein
MRSAAPTVGMLSPRSILESIDLLTSHSSASASSVRPRSRRSAWSRALTCSSISSVFASMVFSRSQVPRRPRIPYHGTFAAYQSTPGVQ